MNRWVPRTILHRVSRLTADNGLEVPPEREDNLEGAFEHRVNDEDSV